MRKCNFTPSALVYIHRIIIINYGSSEWYMHIIKPNNTTQTTIWATWYAATMLFAWIAKYGNQQLAYKSIGRQLVSSCTHQCTYDYGLYVCVCVGSFYRLLSTYSIKLKSTKIQISHFYSESRRWQRRERERQEKHAVENEQQHQQQQQTSLEVMQTPKHTESIEIEMHIGIICPGMMKFLVINA